MNDQTPSLDDIRERYIQPQSQGEALDPDAHWILGDEFDRAIAKVKADAKRAALEELITDEVTEWARHRVEDELVEWRDSGLSILGRGNGLAIRGRDGSSSSIIRFGFEMAWRFCIRERLEAS